MADNFVYENPQANQTRKRRARIVLSCDYWYALIKLLSAQYLILSTTVDPESSNACEEMRSIDAIPVWSSMNSVPSVIGSNIMSCNTMRTQPRLLHRAQYRLPRPSSRILLDQHIPRHSESKAHQWRSLSMSSLAIARICLPDLPPALRLLEVVWTYQLQEPQSAQYHLHKAYYLQRRRRSPQLSKPPVRVFPSASRRQLMSLRHSSPLQLQTNPVRF